MFRFSTDSITNMIARRAMVHVNTTGIVRDVLVIQSVLVRGRSSNVEKNRYIVNQNEGRMLLSCSRYDRIITPREARNTSAAEGIVAAVLTVPVVNSARSIVLRMNRHADAN